MIPEPLLVRAAAVEIGMLVATWIIIFGHGAFWAARSRRRPRLDRARRVLAAALPERTLDDAGRHALQRLDAAQAAELFATFTPHLRGAERDWLGAVALDLGLADRARRLCRSRLWWRRLQGVRLLTMVGGRAAEEAAVLSLAWDRNPLVRSQVAEWAGAHATEAGIRTLTEMLGDPSRSSRYSVQDALVRLGGLVVEPLALRLASVQNPLAAITGLRVAEGLGAPRLLSAVAALCDAPEPGVRQAAYAALGSIGGEAAGARLVTALGDAHPSARAAAASAIGRMGHWPAASALGKEMAHTAWDVRLASGRALARLGPPGELTLRKVLDSPNAFAADMARHVLDRARLDRTRAAPA